MRIAALGRTRWLYDSICHLKNDGHEIVFIGTARAAPEYEVTADDYERLARRIGCPFLCDSTLDRSDTLSLLRDINADAAISVNWPTLIPRNVRTLFKHGIVNAHTGDLPRFRGNACPNWAILNGEHQIALTLHLMGDGLDDGPVLLKRTFALSDSTYIAEVYAFLTQVLPGAFLEVMNSLQSGMLVPVAQPSDASLSLRCFPRLPEDGEIGWQSSALEISRLVRATAEPFAGAYTFINGQKLIVWRASAASLAYPSLGVPGQIVEIEPGSGAVTVLTGSGVLVMSDVETKLGRGKPSEVIRSTRIRLGGRADVEVLEKRLESLERLVEIMMSRRPDDRKD